jgi:hypothetical protein
MNQNDINPRTGSISSFERLGCGYTFAKATRENSTVRS